MQIYKSTKEGSALEIKVHIPFFGDSRYLASWLSKVALAVNGGDPYMLGDAAYAAPTDSRSHITKVVGDIAEGVY